MSARVQISLSVYGTCIVDDFGVGEVTEDEEEEEGEAEVTCRREGPA